MNDLKQLTSEDKKTLSDPHSFYSYHNFDFKITNRILPTQVVKNNSQTYYVVGLQFYLKYKPFFKKYRKPDDFFPQEEETFILNFYTKSYKDATRNPDGNNAILTQIPKYKLDNNASNIITSNSINDTNVSTGTIQSTNITNIPDILEGSDNRVALILIHGFQSKNKKIYLQLAERFCKRGIPTLVYILPFHFERAPENSDFYKLLDLTDFMNILEFYRQSIIELRLLINYLKTIGFKKVGCMGFSIGGHYCNILSCVEENMDFSIPMASKGALIPISKPSQNAKTTSTKSDSYNHENKKLNFYLMENHHYLVNPIYLKPKIDKHKILLIQGLFDNRAPLPEVLKFRKAWDYPPAVWLPCDHFTFFLFNRLNIILATNFIRSHVLRQQTLTKKQKNL
ncbi:MAG: alpha/beta hydrolase family protein [Actinobacteria bacterium]|nr:alpha/beta hydrolase family protein [Actinomycetota bacterium]